MGLDGGIRKWLQDNVSPSAFATEMKVESDKPTVFVEDTVTRMFRFKGTRLGSYFTGSDLFEEIMSPHIRRLVNSAACCVSVVCADDIERVPREKLATQMERSRQFVKSRAAKAARIDEEEFAVYDDASDSDTGHHAGARAETSHGMDSGATAPTLDYDFKYPGDSRICDDGIRYTDKSGTERFEVIDLPVLMRSRHARNAIWTYVVERMVRFVENPTTPSADCIGEDRLLIIDHFREGPIVFSGRRALRLAPHPLGEGEMQATLWALVFADHPVHVSTIDSDFLPLGLLAADCRTEPLIWSYRTGAGPTMYVDMRHLLNDLTATAGFDVATFRGLCVLNGTDFFKKGDVLNQVGFKSIVQATWRSKAHVRASADESLPLETRRRHFEWVLRAAFATQLNVQLDGAPPTFDALQSVIDDRKLRKYTLPSRTIEGAVSRFGWNMIYWSDHVLKRHAAAYASLRGLHRGQPWRPDPMIATPLSLVAAGHQPGEGVTLVPPPFPGGAPSAPAVASTDDPMLHERDFEPPTTRRPLAGKASSGRFG